MNKMECEPCKSQYQQEDDPRQREKTETEWQ